MIAVAEDRAPRERRDLPHAHRLGEQHRGVGVVAGREVEEADRHEQRVRVGLLERRDEVGPHDLDEHRFDEPVGAAVLRVHREHDEVPQPVLAVALRVERDERVEEVGDAEALCLPLLEVGTCRVQVIRVVRERTRQFFDGCPDPRTVGGCGGVVRGVGDAAVVRLQRLQFRDGGLEVEPGGGRHHIGRDSAGRAGRDRHGSSLGRPLPERFAIGARSLRETAVDGRSGAPTGLR